jgi:hypothetical protein
VKSLEDVIMKYLKEGEQRCLNARKEATNALVDIDDLEVLQTPERYLIRFIFSSNHLFFLVFYSVQ